MKKPFALVCIISFAFFKLFALTSEDCALIIEEQLAQYEKVILDSGEEFIVDDYKFSKISDKYIEVSFKIKAKELKVISPDSKKSFTKELREVFDNELGGIIEHSENFIYQRYKNVTLAKGNLKRGDVVFLNNSNGKRLSFIAEAPIKSEGEKIFPLKPLYNGKFHSSARLEKKSFPLFLDIDYGLGFINTFRNIVSVDAKISPLYPLFLKAGVGTAVDISFEGGFVSSIFGAKIGAECLLPFDYMFSCVSSLNLYTDFNIFFGSSTLDDYFYIIPDVGVGLVWYLSNNFALKIGAKFMDIITFYNFFLPAVNLGVSIIL